MTVLIDLVQQQKQTNDELIKYMKQLDKSMKQMDKNMEKITNETQYIKNKLKFDSNEFNSKLNQDEPSDKSVTQDSEGESDVAMLNQVAIAEMPDEIDP